MNLITSENQSGIRNDGRVPTMSRSLTILIGSKGGFCDLTRGKTRIILFGYITPSIVFKGVIFSKICFSFRFFYENLIKKNFFFFKNKNFSFLAELVIPLKNFLKKWYILEESYEFLGFKPKIEFKIGIIENDGNLQDTINLGVGISIKSLEIPYINFNGQLGVLKWKFIDAEYLNQKKNSILSNSFSIQELFEGSSFFLFDPTYFEELNCNSFLSILMSEKGVIKNFKYGYENGITEENFLNIYKLSLKNFSFLNKLIKKISIQKITKYSNTEIILLT